MNIKKHPVYSAFTNVLIFSFALLASCGRKSAEGLIIFTQETTGGQEKIAACVTGKPGSDTEELTGGFYSAKSPALSSDGTKMIFSAMKKKGDGWAIWEMNLSGLKSRQVTSLEENCFDPAYLPTGRIVFIREQKGNPGSGGDVFSCNADGTDIRQVTFNPYHYSALTVLKDGRLLAICRGLSSEKGRAVYMVMRPDGTKNQLFYEGREGNNINSRCWETDDGKLVFVESDGDNGGNGSLVSITYNRPLHSATVLSSEITSDFISVFPLKGGKYIVSCRKPGSEKYGMYEFNPGSNSLGDAICESSDFNVKDIVVTGKHIRARKLPSEVDMGVKTGLLLCQNINFSAHTGQEKKDIAKVKFLRIAGRDSTLGEFEAEQDGSFYLKVKADMPFQIQKIDENGNVIGQPCEWIYLRPNERRGCVGCHEDPEQVPVNQIPMAVKNKPVGIPDNIHKVVEKKVELE